MAKQIFRILDDLSPSEAKLRNLPRKPDGLYNMHLNEYGQLEKRKGYSKYNATTINADYKIIGMHRFYKQDTSSKEFLVACGTILYKFADAIIDVGSTASDRAYAIAVGGTGATYIDENNPAASTGKITSVEIFANEDMTDATVAIFYVVSGNNLSARDSQYIGNVTAGSKQTFTVDLNIVIGDYIGLYWKTGKLEAVNTSGDGVWYQSGDQTSCTNQVFGHYDNFTISLYGAGLDIPIVDATTPIKQSLTANKEMFFTDFLNHCYFVNGVNGVFKYDMTNVRTVNMTVPIAPTGVSNLDGSLTEGIYYYKVTYVDEDGYESNGGAASAAITALAHPNDGVTLTIPVSSDTKVTKRRIYRTTAGGAIYYYEGEVANNSGETFNSTIADATIGQNTVLHTDHNIPPTTSHLITKRMNRIYLAYAGNLCISKLSGECEYFPTAWYQETGNMEKITGILEHVDTLAVTTDDSVEKLLGTDEDNFEFRPIYSTKGCIAPRSKVNCDNLLVFLDFEGLYYFDGLEIKELNVYLNEYIRANINQTYASLSASDFFDNKYLFSYPKGVSTIPNETLYYDFRNNSYGIYSFAFGCYSKWDKGADGLQLKGGSTTEGRVYSVLMGTTDDTAAITCYDKPEPIDFGKPDIWKQFYHIYIKVKSTTGTALRFYYTLDDASETYKDLTLIANKTLWYKIDLIEGGQRARAFTPRPYVSDAYDITYMGYAFVFEEEAPEYA